MPPTVSSAFDLFAWQRRKSAVPLLSHGKYPPDMSDANLAREWLLTDTLTKEGFESAVGRMMERRKGVAHPAAEPRIQSTAPPSRGAGCTTEQSKPSTTTSGARYLRRVKGRLTSFGVFCEESSCHGAAGVKRSRAEWEKMTADEKRVYDERAAQLHTALEATQRKYTMTDTPVNASMRGQEG